ncbi:MAG: DUF3299 domain-containing protein [Planctomycetota bacterium]
MSLPHADECLRDADLPGNPGSDGCATRSRTRLRGVRRAATTALALACLSFVPRGEDPVETSFTTLAGFDFQPGMTLPAEVTALDGKTVMVQGFMQPETDGETDLTYFLLINDACGCQGTPKLNEIVYCAMPDGETTKLLPGIVKVTGTLYVGEEKEGEEVVGLYYLDVDEIH